MRNISPYLLFGFIGLMGIIVPIYDILSGGQRFILVDQQNIIFGYSFLLASLLISFAIMSFPYLIRKYRIKGKYSEIGKYSKVKFDFIIGILLLPGLIFACISFCVALANKAIVVGFIAFSIIYYVDSIYTVIKYKESKNSE